MNEPAFDELDELRMKQALRSAADAAEEGEVPVGAVIYHQGRLIARAHNQRETSCASFRPN